MQILNVPAINSSEYWQAILLNGLGCTLGSFLAIFFSYLIYRSSIRNNRNQQDSLERLNYLNTRQHFTNLVRSIATIAQQQLKNFTTFREELEKNPSDYPMLPYTPMYDFDRVSLNQSLDKVLVAYTSLAPGDPLVVNAFSNLTATIDYLNDQVKTQVRQIEKAQGYDHERKILLRDNYRQITETLGRILSIDPYPYPAELRQALLEIRDHFENANGNYNDFNFILKELIEPLFNTLKKIYDNGMRNPEVIELLTLSHEAIKLFEEMKKQNVSIAEDIKTTIQESSEKGLKRLLEYATSLDIQITV